MQDMINDLEQEFGGKIRWRTFSIWFAETGGVLRKYGAFLFLIDDVLHIRDYKHTKTIIGIKVKDKDEENYVRYDEQFPLSSIKRTFKVTRRKAARSVIQGQKVEKQSSLLARIFRETVLAVETEEKQYFFEFPDKEFRKMVGK